MRIVLLAVDDEFAGEMQRYLYEKHPDWIVGTVISTRLVYKKSNLGAAWMVLRHSGFTYLMKMTYNKMLRLFFDKRERFLPSRLAEQHKVEQYRCSDINDAQSLAKLRSWTPDIVISTNFSHYIGKAVRESIARYGVWNLHKSLLPQYRGMAPSFHALFEGASRVGATLHVVAKGFDTGDLLAQTEVPVTKTDSVYSLNRKTSRAGGKLLASYLETYDPNVSKAGPQPEGQWKNYTNPTRLEVKEFHKKGLHLCRINQDEN